MELRTISLSNKWTKNQIKTIQPANSVALVPRFQFQTYYSGHLTCTLLFSQVVEDKLIRREVFAIIVHCSFMEDGCKWEGEVRHLEVLVL